MAHMAGKSAKQALCPTASCIPAELLLLYGSHVHMRSDITVLTQAR